MADKTAHDQPHHVDDDKMHTPFLDSGPIPVEQERDGHAQKIPYNNAENHEQKIPVHTLYGQSQGLEPVTYDAYHKEDLLPPSQEAPDAPTPTQTRPRRSRRRIFIIGAIIILIVLAAVLGGALGSQLHKSGSSSAKASGSGTTSTSPVAVTPIQAIDKTGLASAASTDGSGMFTYYQTTNGSVVEAYFLTGVLNATSDRYQTQGSSIVPIGDVALGSPMAAVSYVVNGTTYRQLFYAASNLTLMHVIATGSAQSQSWSVPMPVTTEQTLFSGSNSFCAIAVSPNNVLRGVRTFLATSSGQVFEYGWDQLTDGDVMKPWRPGQTFNANPSTGCACSASSYNADVYTHVWFQSSSSFQLTHGLLLNSPGNVWTLTNETYLEADPSFAIMNGSAMTVAVDQANHIQYLYYQSAADSRLRLVTSLTNPPALAEPSLGSFNPIGNSRMTASSVSGAPAVVYQINGSVLQIERIASQGSVLSNGTLVST